MPPRSLPSSYKIIPFILCHTGFSWVLMVGKNRVSSGGFKGDRIITTPNDPPHYSEGRTARDMGWSCLGLLTHEDLPLESLEREFRVNSLLVAIFSQVYLHFSVRYNLSFSKNSFCISCKDPEPYSMRISIGGLENLSVMKRLKIIEYLWLGNETSGMGRHSPKAEFSFLPFFVNKVLSAHSHVHSFRHYLWCFHSTVAELSSCIRNHMA